MNTIGRALRWTCVGAFVILLFLVAGCSTTTKDIDPRRAASIKRVGVISLLPTELLYQKIGVTVFNNERSTQSVGMALNDAARNGVESGLQKGRLIEVIQLNVEIEAMKRDFRPGAIVFSWPPAAAKKALIDLAKRDELDAIVVVNEVFDSDNGHAGVKFFLRAGIGSISAAGMRSDIEAVLYDSQGEVLVSRHPKLGVLYALDRPNMKPWGYALDENLDAATRNHVVSSFQRLIYDGISQSVTAMNL